MTNLWTAAELEALLTLPLQVASYRGSQSKYATHYHRVQLLAPPRDARILAGKAAGEITYRWGAFGRRERHQVADTSSHTFWLRPDWPQRVPEDYWLVDNKLVLDVGKATRRGAAKVYPARWVEQARGADLKSVDGVLVVDASGEGHLAPSETAARRRGWLGRAALVDRLTWLETTFARVDDETWKRFYRAAAQWLDAPALPARAGREALRGAVLQAAPSRELERQLPWLFGAVRVGPAPDLVSIRDWVLARQPSLSGVSWGEARAKARAWHDSLWSEAALEEAAGVEAPGWLLVRRFQRVTLALPEGWSWRTSRDPAAYQQVGRILGHCYRERKVLDRYRQKGSLHVLFDPAGNPHVTAELSRARRVGPVLGAQDKPAAPQFHPAIGAWGAAQSTPGGAGEWAPQARAWAERQTDPDVRSTLLLRGWLGPSSFGLPEVFTFSRRGASWTLDREITHSLVADSGTEKAPWLVRVVRAAPKPWQILPGVGWTWSRLVVPRRKASIRRAVAAYMRDVEKLHAALLRVRYPRWLTINYLQGVPRAVEDATAMAAVVARREGRPARGRRRGRSAKPAWWAWEELPEVTPEVPRLVRAEAEMVARLVPAMEEVYPYVGVAVGRPFADAAYYELRSHGERAAPYGRILIGSAVASADLMAHESGHLLDAFSRVGEGQCMMGSDWYASHEPGPIRELTLRAREVFKREADSLLHERVRSLLVSAGLTRGEVTRALAGEGIRVERVLRRLGVPADRVEEVFSYSMPFGGFDSRRWSADTGMPSAPAKRVAAAFRLLPVGIPIRLMDAESGARIDFARTITVREARQRVHGYFLAPHEVFARVFDQAIRQQAERRGVLAGSPRHELDISPEAFAPFAQEFWSVMKGVDRPPTRTSSVERRASRPGED